MDITARLDPEIAALLPQLPLPSAASAAPDGSSPNAARATMPMPELSDAVERSEHVVPAVDGRPEVPLRVHRPKGVDGVLPCVYAIHGGGYNGGTYDMDDVRFDRWCPSLHVVGVSVDYRLAPGTPYPGPLEDCYAGLQWTHDHADELGIDTSRVGIFGASAGGGLAAALAILARDRGGPPIAFQQLMYPMIDDRQTTTSSRWDVPIWNPAANEMGWRAYLGERYGTDDIPAHAAPSRADDLTGLPPAFVAVGTLDGFCDEDIDYAMRLNQAGVPVELHVYPGAPHGFEGLVPNAEVSRRARRHQREWLVAQLGLSPG